MNVCIKIHGNKFCRYGDIPLDQYTLWRTWMCLQNVTALHLLDMEIFHWTNGNLDLLVVLEVRGVLKQIRLILWGP